MEPKNLLVLLLGRQKDSCALRPALVPLQFGEDLEAGNVLFGSRAFGHMAT